MVHFTMFGGSEVKMSRDTKVIITVFGGTDVAKPTMARRLLQEKQMLQSSPGSAVMPEVTKLAFGNRPGHHASVAGKSVSRNVTFIFTIFGAVEIKPPPLAEEFMDMRELVTSGLISRQEWDQLMGQMYQRGDLDGISSFTMFGGMDESSIPEEEEIKKIRSACELGLISSEEEQALRSVVGRDPQQIRVLLRDTAFA